MDLNMEGDVECQKCCVLKTEMEEKVTQAEQTNTQQLTAYLMLKQKIISTDKMIREYQSSKAESELLSRKNAEFAQLIDQLHRDLSARSQECSTMRQEMDPLKKANADYKAQAQAAKKEAEKWKYEVDATKHFTNQLVAKVKDLEKFEEEVKTLSNKVKEHEKVEKKIKQLKDQNKEAKDTSTKIQKELKKMQKDQKLMTKYALAWAKVADSHGKMNSYHKRFYEKLKSSNNNTDEDCDDDDEDQGDFEETDAQSKLLEQMLTDELESDAQEILSTPVKAMPTTPKAKRTPVAKTPTRGASSSPRTRSSERNRTPIHTPTARSKRARLSESASETSITPMSLGIFELKSHKESDTLCNEREKLPDKPCSSPLNEELSAGAEPLIDVNQDENDKPETLQGATSQSDCGGEEALPRKAKRGRPRKNIIKKAPSPLPTTQSEQEDQSTVPLPSLNIPDVNKNIFLPTSPKSTETETSTADTAQPSTDESIERQDDDAPSTQSEQEVNEPPPPNVEDEQPERKEENETLQESAPIEIADDVLKTPVTVEQTSDVSSQELESRPEVNPSKSPAPQTQKTMDEEPSDIKEADGKSEETNSMFSIDDSLTLPTSSTKKSNESTIIDNAEPENEGPTVDPCSKNVECQDKEVTRPTEPETASAVQPKSPVAIQHSSIIPQVQQFNNTAQHVHPTNQAAFKVPRVPPLLDATKNSIPVRPTPDPRWTQKFVPASCNEQKDDDELVSILQNIRTNLIKVPRVVSPLATTPEPVPEPVEPKFRFPVLPRCAFNWSAKKIPITNGLNERLGAYLHPGVTVRVRFRRVGALKDIRSPDILCCTIRDVANFAEAERRPRPVVMINSPPMARSEPPFDTQELTIEEESRNQKRSRSNNIPTLTSLRPIEDNKKSKLPNAFNQPEDCTVKKKAHRTAGNHHLPQAQTVKSSKPMQKETEELPSSGKRSTTVLFGSSSSSSSDSEPEEVTITISSSAMLPPPHLVKEIPIRPLPSRQPLPSSPFHAAALSLKNRPNRLAIRPIDPSSALVRTATNRLTPSPVSQQPAKESITCSKSVGKTRVLPPPRRKSQDSTMSNVTDSVAPLSEPLPQDVNLPQQNAKKRIARSSKRGLGSDSDSPSSEVTPVAKKRKEKDDGQQARPLPPSMGLSPARALPKSPLSSSSLTESPTSGVLTRSRVAKLGTGTELVLAAPTAVPTNQPSKMKKVLKNRVAQQSSEQEEIMEASIEEPAAKEHPSKLNTVLDNTVTQQPIDQEETSIEEPAAKEDKLEKTVEPSVLSTNDDSQLPSYLPVTSQSEDKFPRSSVTRDDSILSPSCDEPSSPSSPMSAPPSVTKEQEPLEEEREEPATFEVYDTPQSPCNESLLEPTEEALKKDPLTAIIPTSRVEDTKQNLSAFELISSKSINTPAPAKKLSKKIKASVHSVINKVLKTEQVTAETMATCVERVTWPQNQEHPEVFIRQLMSSIINSSDSLLDLSMTPPAPPLTVAQQRCVALLKAVDLKNKELKVEADYDPNLYCNYFLNEICHLMFQPLSKLTLVEMNALARTYTAVCRSRGMLQRARVFLFDCLYCLQPRSYSLTYTILSIWTEVLRPVSFPFGLTCTDRTIAYLLLNCCKVEGVRGIEGKVLQVRQLLQTILGYKDVPVNTVDELVTHLMQRLSETKSVDEATSLSWNLSLLARWEGNAWGINIIEKQLWPFLQKWSTGQSSNAAAAAAISCIGLLAKYVTTQQRNAIKTVLTALKVILQSGEACSAVEEAAAESIILLGEKDEPQAIIQIVKDWKPANGIISERLQTILHLFFQRHSVSTV